MELGIKGVGLSITGLGTGIATDGIEISRFLQFERIGFCNFLGSANSLSSQTTPCSTSCSQEGLHGLHFHLLGASLAIQ